MQPNTALSFWLCGIGAPGLAVGWWYPTAVCGVIVVTVALLVILQYVFRVDLGIDQCLLAIDITRQSLSRSYGPHHRPLLHSQWTCPGVNESTGTTPISPLALGAGAVMVTALALAMLVGYATNTADLHRWGPYIQMALHTTFGFVLIGIGILAFAWVDDRTRITGTSTLLPILLGIGVLTATLCAGGARSSGARLHQAHDPSRDGQRRKYQKRDRGRLGGANPWPPAPAKRWESAGRPTQRTGQRKRS
jgi:hypothetical protein